jgi:hypothetical protein
LLKASSVTGFFAAQFARAAGMRVIAVADYNKHGQRLMTIGVGMPSSFPIRISPPLTDLSQSVSLIVPLQRLQWQKFED